MDRAMEEEEERHFLFFRIVLRYIYFDLCSYATTAYISSRTAQSYIKMFTKHSTEYLLFTF